MRKTLVTFVFILIFIIFTSSNTLSVNAELSGTGKCAITITTDHTFNNKAQAKGPCEGYVEGYYFYQNGHDFRVTGSIDTSVQDGEKYNFFLPPPAGDFYDYELTVKTVVKEQPKPDPKPDPKPEPKPEKKPDPKPKPDPEPVKKPDPKPKKENKSSSDSNKTTSSSSKDNSSSKKVTKQQKESTNQPKQESKNESTSVSDSNNQTVASNTDDKAEEKSDSSKKKEADLEEKDDTSNKEDVTESEDNSEKTNDEDEEKDEIEAIKAEDTKSSLPILLGIAVVAVLTFGGFYTFHSATKEKINRFIHKVFKRKTK